MGGGILPPFPASSEDGSSSSASLDYEFQEYSYHHHSTLQRDEEFVGGSNDFEQVRHKIFVNSLEFDGNLRKRKNAFRETIKSYDHCRVRMESLPLPKARILSYTPGSWVSNAGGKKQSDYVIPKTSTLLLIGPKGSGKSSLINRISRVFEDDMFASERAQVAYNSLSGEGTYFLQEYMIPKNSTSFCLFDTRGLSENLTENYELLECWMKEGVRHGQIVVRDSDSSSLKMALMSKAQQSGSPCSEIRKVNFAIYVVNGFSVLRAMNDDKEEERRYMETMLKTFSCPHLSFRDDKPVIVVTHGDLLSLEDRAHVRVYLGEKLGVPPAKQIFDIPDNSDPSTELTIIDMLRYSLEHTDKNLHFKTSEKRMDESASSEQIVNYKVFRPSFRTFMFLAVLLFLACGAFVHREPDIASASTMHPKSNSATSASNQEPYIASASTMHQKSNSATSSTLSPPSVASKSTSPPKSVEYCHCKHPKSRTPSRSPSPGKRYREPVVEWHKIRHLW